MFYCYHYDHSRLKIAILVARRHFVAALQHQFHFRVHCIANVRIFVCIRFRCFRNEFIFLYSSGQPSRPHLTWKFGIAACSIEIFPTNIFNFRFENNMHTLHIHVRAIFC